MNGLWLENQHLSWRADIPVPSIPQGSALVRPLLVGVCSTDLEMLRGYYPFTGVPGHEFVGEVVEAPGHEDWVGRRVVGEINLTCGVCDACISGRSHHCSNRTVLGILNHGGVMADFFTLPINNLHQVPDSVSNTSAVFTEPLAAALQIQEQVQVQPGMRVLVVGAGRLGLLIAQTLRLTGCDLKVVARRERPVQLLNTLNIEAIPVDAVKPAQADLVVEVTGSEGGFALSRKAVRPMGTLVLKSTFAGNVSLNLSSLVVDEISVVGSRCGAFAPALRLLAKKLVNPELLIEDTLPMHQGLAGFELAQQPGALKVLLAL